MKKYFILFAFGISTLHAQLSYNQQKSLILKDKLSLKQNQIKTDSIRSYLLNSFENNFYPYWKGTPWAYEGYTNTPKKSSIACGYFVSTTLKHMGFNWNRYDLAKMYSKQVVEEVCDSLRTFTSISSLEAYIKNKPDNLYFIGLRSHIGILMKYNSKIWFIHSDYYDYRGPVKENINNCNALKDSDIFWCGTFFSDVNISKWLSNSKFYLNEKKKY